eukprot:1056145-Pyramimonas_sp.AAC.1
MWLAPSTCVCNSMSESEYERARVRDLYFAHGEQEPRHRIWEQNSVYDVVVNHMRKLGSNEG